MTLKTSKELAQHITQLAAAFGVQLMIIDELPPDVAMAMTPQRDLTKVVTGDHRKAVMCRPVTDETSYIVAMHEIGHHLHPLGMVNRTAGSDGYRKGGPPGTERDIRLLLTAEEAAWEWAQLNALEWTPVMQQVKDMTLGSYYALARKVGVPAQLKPEPSIRMCQWCGTRNRIPVRARVARCGKCRRPV